jgi:hypothetical protein
VGWGKGRKLFQEREAQEAEGKGEYYRESERLAGESPHALYSCRKRRDAYHGHQEESENGSGEGGCDSPGGINREAYCKAEAGGEERVEECQPAHPSDFCRKRIKGTPHAGGGCLGNLSLE